MTFRLRLIWLFVGIFFLIFSLSLLFIYLSLANEREEEFYERLKQKSITTAKLLIEVKQVDQNMLRIIDQNSINQMYDEKILVFDSQDRIVYSSLDDEPIVYSKEQLDRIRSVKYEEYIDEDDDEVVGILYTENEQELVVLASAYDKYGKQNLQNLLFRLIAVLIAGIGLIFLSGFYYIRQIFQPIYSLKASVQSVTAENLNEYIAVKDKTDDLGEIAVNYNQMLKRLYEAFEAQRAFVNNASHELKTPLARITSLIEQKLASSENVDYKQLLEHTNEQLGVMTDLVESLLLLHRLQAGTPITSKKVRIDETLYECMNELHEHQPQVHFHLNIDEQISDESQLETLGNPLLMKIAIQNLLKNASLYSTRPEIDIQINIRSNSIVLSFANSGSESLDEHELFRPFQRGITSRGIEGTGLGLCIVKQIMQVFHGQINYKWREETLQHLFLLTFPGVITESKNSNEE